MTRERDGVFRTALRYVPVVGRILLAIIAGVLIFMAYRAAASASFFEARSINISGTSRASADEIKAIVRRASSRTGVWRADLAAISDEIEKLTWVRTAFVSRVLPDGLRVRVLERAPRAVVRTSAGRLQWVDDDAVNLGHMSPTDQMPSFFIRGWDESGTPDARRENKERMQKYIGMLREWTDLGLAERISEVNLGDLHDVRAQLAGDDSHIEVRLGGESFGKRLRQALEILDRDRHTPRGPFIIYLDATPGKNIVVGHSLTPLALDKAAEEDADSISRPNSDEAMKKPAASDSNTEAPKRRNRDKRNEAQRKTGRARTEASAGGTKKETRPRRVG